MYKIVWLLKRKPGITHEQFRDHYENSHSVLAKKHFGHLLTAYRRNYNAESWGGGVTGPDGSAGFGPREWAFDCIAEWEMRAEADFIEIMRLVALPDIAPIFYADEEPFLDRDATMLIKCEMRDTGTS
jgi:hypothetical protein